MLVCPGQWRPDNMGVKTYLQFSDNGMWLTQEPPRRFSFQLRSHLLDYMYGWRNLDAYLLGLQLLVRTEFQNGSFWYQHVFISSSTSWTFLGFHIHYIQAGFLLLGIQFSTDRYNDPCLIKCVDCQSSKKAVLLILTPQVHFNELWSQGVSQSIVESDRKTHNHWNLNSMGLPVGGVVDIVQQIAEDSPAKTGCRTWSIWVTSHYK